MSYSTRVNIHRYCSSFIIILLISSLSPASDSLISTLSLISSLFFISTLQSQSAFPSSLKSQASKTKTTLARRRSRAARTESDWRVWVASELGTPISLSNPTIRLETKTVTENWSDMEGEWVRFVVIVSLLLWLLLWKIGESLLLWLLLCRCCCARSVNQWPDFVEGWLAGVGVDGEDEVVSLCQRGEGRK